MRSELPLSAGNRRRPVRLGLSIRRAWPPRLALPHIELGLAPLSGRALQSSRGPGPSLTRNAVNLHCHLAWGCVPVTWHPHPRSDLSAPLRLLRRQMLAGPRLDATGTSAADRPKTPTASWPCARSRSTRSEPMSPQAPVTPQGTTTDPQSGGRSEVAAARGPPHRSARSPALDATSMGVRVG